MEDVRLLGRNVKRIREQRRLSLGGLAKATGLSKQTLANLEGGAGNPTVATLLSVARALGVAVQWLLTEWGAPTLVQPAAAAEWESVVGGRRRLLDRTRGSGLVTAALLELEGVPPGEALPLVPASGSGTLHHLYVISGSVTAGPAEQVHRCVAGDFIRFAGDVPHVMVATSERAAVHLVTTMPDADHFSSD